MYMNNETSPVYLIIRCFWCFPNCISRLVQYWASLVHQSSNIGAICWDLLSLLNFGLHNSGPRPVLVQYTAINWKKSIWTQHWTDVGTINVVAQYKNIRLHHSGRRLRCNLIFLYCGTTLDQHRSNVVFKLIFPGCIWSLDQHMGAIYFITKIGQPLRIPILHQSCLIDPTLNLFRNAAWVEK